MYNIKHIDNFEERIKFYTFDLIDVIPFDQLQNYNDGGFVWSGGLLYDVITEHTEVLDNLSDIDLFFFGNVDVKIETLKQILLNLESKHCEYLIGFDRAIVWIFVKGIKRIIQLIFTENSCADEIIDTFDFTHVQSYWDGVNLYCKNDIDANFQTNQTELNYKCHPSRAIKCLRKNLSVNKILYDDYNFILNSNEFFKFRNNILQSKYYSDPSNYMNLNKDALAAIFNCNVFENIDQINLLQIKNLLLNANANVNANVYINEKTNCVESDLDINDDDIRPIQINRQVSKLYYLTQKYIYVPCKIFDIIRLENLLIHVEFSERKVKDYLLDLIENLYADVETYNEKNKYGSFDFNHNFINSLGYPRVNAKRDTTINSTNLCYQFNIQNEMLLDNLNINQNVYILFEINVNEINKINYHMKLKPVLIESDKFKPIYTTLYS